MLHIYQVAELMRTKSLPNFTVFDNNYPYKSWKDAFENDLTDV